jgi:AcrR family transcriptional regulator
MEITQQQLRWIRPPRQERTQKTLVALLDAAESLLADKGFDDITVADVAARAGSSVGAFYRRFSDKDALLHALHERYCEEATITANEALDPERWDGIGIAEMLSAQIDFLVEVFGERRGLDRAIYLRTFRDAAFSERSARLQNHVTDGMTALLAVRKAEFAHPDPALAIDFALRVTFSFLTDHFTVGDRDSGRTALSDATVARELTRTVLSLLGVTDTDTESSD